MWRQFSDAEREDGPYVCFSFIDKQCYIFRWKKFSPKAESFIMAG